MHFYYPVHVEDYACAYPDPVYFEVWRAHFGGDLDSDLHLDVKLLGDVTHLLQMRIIETNSPACLD